MTKKSNDRTVWPDRGDLAEIRREASAHRRAWGMVDGLARSLQEEREKGNAARVVHQAAQIQQLERKVIGQKEGVRKLEECRRFEAESEAMLVGTIQIIAHGELPSAVHIEQIARQALERHMKRKGPRSKEVVDAEILDCPHPLKERKRVMVEDSSGLWVDICEACDVIVPKTVPF